MSGDGVKRMSMKLNRQAFHLEYLGFAACVATLPIYEPALHSFHTIAPDLFENASPYSYGAVASAFLTAVAVLVLRTIGRRRAGRLPVSETKACQQSWQYRLLLQPAALPYKIAMAAGILIGTLGLCLIAGQRVPAVATGALGACGGIGSALVLMAWGDLFRTCTKTAILAHLAAAAVLSALLLNAIGTLPYPIACALTLVLATIGFAVPSALLTSRQAAIEKHQDTEPLEGSDKPVSADAPQSQASRCPHRTAPLAAHLAETLIGITLFGLSFQVLGTHDVYLFYLTFLVGTIVAGIAVLPLLLLGGTRPTMALLYEVVLPLTGFAIIAVTLVVPEAAHLFVARSGFMVFFSFAVLLFLSSLAVCANAGEYEPQRVFAAGIAHFSGASLAGMAARAVVPMEALTVWFTVLTLLYLAFLAIRPNVVALHRARTTSPTGPGEPAKEPADHTAIDRSRLDALAQSYALTGRETEILALLAQGQPAPAIARELYISDSTARGHAHKIYQKFGVSTKEELLATLAGNQEPEGKNLKGHAAGNSRNQDEPQPSNPSSIDGI